MNPTTTFWIVAAVFVAAALAFLLPALLRRRPAAARAGRRGINIAVYRDQMKEMEADHRNGLLTDEQFASAKVELEARLAEDALDGAEEPEAVRRGGRALGYGLAVLVPAAAFGLYVVLGDPAAIERVAAGPAAQAGGHDIAQLVSQVEEKARANPDDGEAWAMLARTYAAVGRWTEAQPAFEKAIAILPGQAALLSGYAEVLAINGSRVIEGKPMELVKQALAIDPDDIKALELSGIASFQDKNYAQAAFFFKRLRGLVPPETPYAQDIAEAEQEARRLAEAGLTGMDNLAGPAKPVAPGASIRGVVDIAPALKARISPQDTVFLFARPAAGGPPAAALRATAGNFPLEFELSDAMAMNPDNRLSSYKEVTLTARVAKSGDVKGATGDLEGSLVKVKVGASGVRLVIDTVRE